MKDTLISTAQYLQITLLTKEVEQSTCTLQQCILTTVNSTITLLLTVPHCMWAVQVPVTRFTIPFSTETMLQAMVQVSTGEPLQVKSTIQNSEETVQSMVVVSTSTAYPPIQTLPIHCLAAIMLPKTVVPLNVMRKTLESTTSHSNTTMPENTVRPYVGNPVQHTVTETTTHSTITMQALQVQLLHGWK